MQFGGGPARLEIIVEIAAHALNMAQDIMFVAQFFSTKVSRKEQRKYAPHYYLLQLLTIETFAVVHYQTAPRYQLEQPAQVGGRRSLAGSSLAVATVLQSL